MKQALFLSNTDTKPDSSSFVILLTETLKAVSDFAPCADLEQRLAPPDKVLSLRWHRGPGCFPDFRASF